MATFVNNLRLKEINTGDESGTWGASTNTNLELIGAALGYGTKNMAADSNTTFTMPDFSNDGVRSMHLKITSGVALTATREVTLGPNTVSKFWIVENATTGGQSLTLKQGSGSTVSVPNGGSVAIYTEGSGAGAGVKDSLANINITGTGVFTNLTAASADINGGTIDGAALGSSVALTALTLAGNLDVSGGTIKLDGSFPIGVGNVVMGFEAGDAFTGSNLYNVAIGYRALKNSTAGSGNVAVGSNALENNTVIGNMAFGTAALNLNTTGNLNTAVGLQSQANNLVGQSNTSLGYHSLEANLSDNNIAIGTEALTASTTGSRNVAMGAHVLRATQVSSDVIGIGYKTLDQVLTGNSTVDFGNREYLLSASNGSSTITVTMPDNLTAEMKNLKVGDGFQIFGNYQGGIGKPTLGGNIDAIVLTGSNTTFSNKTHTITSIIGGDTGNQFTFTATDSGGAPVLANALDTGDGDDGSGYNLNATQYNNIAIGNFNMTAATSAAFNTVIGNRAGRSLTSGYWNTLIGHAAGEKITNDQRNTMVGQYAGNRNESSFNTYLGPFNGMNHTASTGQNIAIGSGAYGGQTGTQNITMGLSNLLVAGDYSRNIAIGFYAGYSLGGDSTGTGAFDSDNTLVGHFSGGYLLNQNAVKNVAMGVHALRGDPSLNYIAAPLGPGFNVKESVAIGWEAFSSATGSNGDYATAVGHRALHVNNGPYNTAIGHDAGLTNTTGQFNTLLGALAGKLLNNTTANCAVGYAALSGSNGGSGENTAIGALCSANLTTGSYNVANGTYALSANLTGNNNVSIGHRSLDAHLGSNCVAVGKDASTNVTTSDNTIAIGYNAQPSTNTVDNEITLGDANITALRCNVTTISSLSDIRDKSNIEDLPIGLEFVNALNPVKFDWSRRDGSMEGAKDIGFIAQDLDNVQENFNIADYANLVLKENPDKLEASYGKLVPVLVKAIQELSAEVAELKEKL
jgi:hypothetical protein